AGREREPHRRRRRHQAAHPEHLGLVAQTDDEQRQRHQDQHAGRDPNRALRHPEPPPTRSESATVASEMRSPVTSAHGIARRSTPPTRLGLPTAVAPSSASDGAMALPVAAPAAWAAIASDPFTPSAS